MLDIPDLLISGSHPLIWLLALLTARAGYQVSVKENPAETAHWRLAEAPFAWFGESPPNWNTAHLNEYFSGLTRFNERGEWGLHHWPTGELDGTKMHQQMRQDALQRGAQICTAQEWQALESRAPLVFYLDQLPSEQGFWIWKTPQIFTPPGICEIIPPFHLSAISGKFSLLALAGQRQEQPERPIFWPENLICPEPIFEAQRDHWPACHRSAQTLRLELDLAWVLPEHTLKQALYLMWIRHVGQALERNDLHAPGITERLSDYWGKLITGAAYNRQKFIFLR
jgi:hypothetical protein